MDFYNQMLKEVEGVDSNIKDELSTVPEPVEIYFSDLVQDVQEKIINNLLISMNATEDDEESERKIRDQLVKSPIMIIDISEFKRSQGLDI